VHATVARNRGFGQNSVLAHVVFELAWAGQRLTLGVWVPGLVAAWPGKRIAETSWPGYSVIEYAAWAGVSPATARASADNSEVARVRARTGMMTSRIVAKRPPHPVRVP
jgi:hypothetical protein